MAPLPTKPKLKTLTWYKKELDRVFSIFIRMRDDGQCYTCPKKDEVKKMQNGHFVPRQYLSTRWNEINCHCQCYACNMLYNGQPSRYAQRLRIDFGPDIVDELERDRMKPVKLEPYWYMQQIAHYKEEVEKFSTYDSSMVKTITV